jgi:hypothetical protein
MTDATAPVKRILRDIFKLGRTGNPPNNCQPYYNITEDWIKWKVTEIYADESLKISAKKAAVERTLTKEAIQKKLERTKVKTRTALKRQAAPTSVKRPRKVRKTITVVSGDEDGSDDEEDSDNGDADSERTLTDDAKPEELGEKPSLFSVVKAIVSELKADAKAQVEQAKRREKMFYRLESILKKATKDNTS